MSMSILPFALCKSSVSYVIWIKKQIFHNISHFLKLNVYLKNTIWPIIVYRIQYSRIYHLWQWGKRGRHFLSSDFNAFRDTPNQFEKSTPWNHQRRYLIMGKAGQHLPLQQKKKKASLICTCHVMNVLQQFFLGCIPHNNLKFSSCSCFLTVKTRM